MLKLFLLIGLAVLALWLLRRAGGRRTRDIPPAQGPAEQTAERMVQCAHCGVNQPIGESILAGGRYYCSPAHRQAAGPDTP